MRLINRNGSTLALTIMVFAVLMILATFTLSFMVTENKQAMYYQNKTQAHYIARSGADAVEKALVTQLESYSEDISNVNTDAQNAFIDQYDSPGQPIAVDIENLVNPVLIINEQINDKRVMTIQATAKYGDVTQSVKKIVYSNYGMKTSSGFIPSDGELFIYLGDVTPKEWKNGSIERDIPKEYIKKAIDKSEYIKQKLPTVNSWDVTNTIVVNNKISSGVYNESMDIFVDGNLEMKGDIFFNGLVNIHVRGQLSFKEPTNIIGKKDPSTNKYNLNIYVYNELKGNSDNIAVRNSDYNTNSNSGTFKILGNLYVDKGDINLGLPGTGEIDGHIIYNGTDKVNLKTNSSNYNRIITGSIYAPFGEINLGIHSDKVAVVVGGQIIGNSINIYPSNQKQGTRFFEKSTAGRINNNPIPIGTTETIDGYSVNYLSFYVD